MAAHEFTISAHELDAGGKEYTFPVRAAWMRGAFEETDVHAPDHDGVVKVRASKSAGTVIVHGRLDASVVATCGRCLSPANIAVHQQVSAVVVPSAELKAKARSSDARSSEDNDLDITPDEPDTLAFDGETVVLDNLIRDELLLAVPMIPLCREDCPGIKPFSPSDTVSPEEDTSESMPNIDPRLAPLMQIRNRMKE